MRVFDYETDFPNASPFELKLYTDGLLRFPHVFLEDAAEWGILSRSGVVEIPNDHYDRVMAAFDQRCTETQFLLRAANVLSDVLRQLEHFVDVASCPRVPPELQRRTFAVAEPMATLMAFHVLNWALPLDAFLGRLSGLVGSANAGRELLLTALVPERGSHLLRDARSDDSPGGAPSSLSSIRTSRSRGSALWFQTLLAYPEEWDFLDGVIRICRLAAEAEEARRRIQNRVVLEFDRSVESVVSPENDVASSRPLRDTFELVLGEPLLSDGIWLSGDSVPS